MARRRLSGNVSMSVMAERVFSSTWSPSSPQRSLTSSPSQSSCWFFDVETGPDKASHQMSSGWEIGFDAVPFTISWPSPWHIDGIYVSHTDGASYTKKGPIADECNAHESGDKIEREKQNASLKITTLKKYKLGKVLMEESIKKGTHFIDLIEGWNVCCCFFLWFLFHERIEKENLS